MGLVLEAIGDLFGAVHQLSLQEKPAKVPESKYHGLRENIKKIWDDIIGIDPVVAKA